LPKSQTSTPGSFFGCPNYRANQDARDQWFVADQEAWRQVMFEILNFGH